LKSPEQWRKRIAAKEGTLKAFADVFKSSRFETNGRLCAEDMQQASEKSGVEDSKLDTVARAKKRKRNR
jgi:hypothetical protein